MKTLYRSLGALVIAALSIAAQAQSGQSFSQKTYWASDYGQWQFKGQSANNYQFSPSAVCSVSPPNTSESFMPFATNAPVLILDALPSNTEVVTPTSIVSNASYCGIIAQPVNVHYSFSLMSATAGLQEVLNQISSSILYPTQVILDRNWYSAAHSIPGASPSALIAAAKGSTAAYLVDTTQAPNVYYAWNGSAYAVVPYSSGNLPSGTGIVKVNSGMGALATPGTDYVTPSGSITGNAGTASNLSGTPALPTGVTATTGTVGENDNKLATNAQVYASKIASIPVTSLVLKGNGVAGQSVAATPGTDYLVPGGTLSGKITNGVGYSALYSGSTVDVRVNSCIADAINLANGNTTGICNASGETGILNSVAQINVGNSSGGQVTLIVPSQGQWRGSMTDGTSCTVNQYGNTSILGAGPESGIGSQFAFGATASSSLACVFKLTPLGSQLNYIHDSNFSIVNVNGGPYTGHVTTGGVGANFVGPMYDSSTVDHVVVFDALDATAAQVSGFCCGAVFRNMSINGNYGSGVTPLVITNTSAFNMETLSVVHPGSGKPVIQFTDSSSHTSNVNIHGLYIETSNSDTSTALLQNSGFGSINLSSVTAKAEVASDAATFLTSTNTTNTGITISGFNAVNGGGDWLYPVTAINNAFTGQVVLTDNTGAKGNLGFYSSTATAGNLPSGTGIVDVTGGVGGLATAGQDYLGPNLDNGLNAHGIAATGANQNSYTFFQTGSYCTDGSPSCNPAAVFYGQQVIVGTGLNPLTLLNFNCVNTGAGTAGCGAVFNYPIFSSNNIPTGDKSTAVATQLNVYNNLPGLPAQYFGALGDAYQPPNGCTTTASSTTVTCGDAPFVSTDVGKDFWESGAGTSGAAFHATIATVTNSSTITLSGPAVGSVSSGRAIYGHDDVTALQACYQYSASNSVQCVLRPAPNPGMGLTGFLVGSGSLQLVANNFLEESSATNVIGAGQIDGTNLFCEINGDCLTLAAGPIQGANVTDITFQEDPTQPNSRGIHLNPAAGAFGPGPFTNSNFTNVSVFNPAKECIFFDGGGGPGYDFSLPNQYLNFYQFWCTGPNQSHPSNLILATGQDLQVVFLGGQVNGQGWTISGSGGSTSASAFYPNPLVKITEKTSALGDSPVDWKFIGFTNEVGTQGYYFGNGTDKIRVVDSYIENVSSPLITLNSPGVQFNGVHVANSGNIGGVAQFTGGTTGSLRDTYVFGSINPAALAACSGSGNAIDFAANNSTVMTTSTCRNVVAITGATQGANTCSSPTTQTVTGLQVDMNVQVAYTASAAALTGWGSTGGMVFQAWPSAANTLSWIVCNQTGSSITYSSINFSVAYK